LHLSRSVDFHYYIVFLNLFPNLLSFKYYLVRNMATVNATLKSWQSDRNGKHLVMLRIEASGRTKYVSLGIKVRKSQWNTKKGEVRSGYPHTDVLNDTIRKKLHAAEDILLRMLRDEDLITVDTLKTAISSGSSPTDFWTFADTWLDEKHRRGQIYYWRRARAVLRKFEASASRPLPWKAFTVRLLKKFDLYMVEVLGNSGNTRSTALKVLQTIVNEAIREGQIPPNDNPFALFRMPESEPVERAKLTSEELARMEALDLDADSWECVARDMYLLSFFVRGIRFGDAVRLQWKNISEGRISIKTGKTGEFVSTPVTDQIHTILDRCGRTDNQEEFVFLPLKGVLFESGEHEVSVVSSINARINKHLKVVAKLAGIEKSVSFHTSRHSFSHQAYKSGVSMKVIQGALKHSKASTTDTYLRSLDNENLDDELAKVYDRSTTDKKRTNND